ncbi:mitogen-activated protein kinase-binding protein 1-like isoform X2 [Stegostoma tigrinum]|uniref:mitogen-activated protein kinase-binding protein 1-like isoform X2 n=1 Tax=Stegostoma tigrinum TaxID=3053191 RepID=UPI00202B2E5E|nr:mitogen-activated protein kinase-binding protein 1-like isoform X2 [Stegostoma tigrinum]
MAAAATGSGSITSRLKNLLRSPPAINLRRSRAATRVGTERITLDKVIGITASSSSSLACDLTTGLVAYPAGCVVVLCNPKKNKQAHVLNASRKAVSALAFSPDGKYLVTGESGHMPAVRVWDVSDKVQVAELQCHKYGVSCVSFSPNMKYIVSVGFQHDKLVNVWDWKKNSTVASNKVSNKVTAVSFSEDSSFFVTTGNRHVKFWYLNESKACKANITVPLIGRSALLGELHNNFFSGVACGKGKMSGSTFCITSSGLLCQFNEKRLLDKWLDLKTSAANCISATEDFIFCGCSNGTLKLFNPMNLHFVTNLPKPHYLGVDVAAGIEPSHLICKKTDALYPDTIAVAFDPSNRWLSCVYSDHSLYVWDTKDVKKFGKVYSALYHSSSVWSVEVYPELENSSQACLPSASFLTCSSDNTIRLWNVGAASAFQLTSFHRNIYSTDLIKVVYVDDNIQHLQDTTSNPDRTENGATSEIKSGIRIITISPDGQHLASGDRMGTLRIFDLQFLDELMKVEAHDSEILCLEYSKPETGMNLLATASRDRLIHVLNVDRQYSLVQTLDDHSSSITAVKFAANDSVKMVSCGADKSIYFRTAQKSVDGIQFTRTHHVVGKTTLYDMDIDITRKYVAIGCQDRNIRVFTIDSGKQKKCFKGSQSEDGILLKVQMDPSGTFVATSCSDKNISIFDFCTGECVASIFGHSEIVTGMKFSNDCKYLITVSGDSCIFIWRLDIQLTNCMRHRLSEIKQIAKQDNIPPTKTSAPIRRETFMVQKAASEDQEDDTSEDDVKDGSFQTPLKEPMDRGKTEDAVFLLTNGKLPLWAKRLEAGDGNVHDRTVNSTVEAFQPRGRWAERMDKDFIHSILGRKQLEEYCATPTPGNLTVAQGLPSSHLKEQDKFGPQNLDNFLEMMELSPSLLSRESMGRPSSICLEDAGNEYSHEVDTVEMELSAPMFYPVQNDHSTSTENDYQVKEPPKKLLESESEWKIVHSVENSPDSAYSMDSGSNEQQQDDSDSVGQLSSDGHYSGLEEEEEQCCAVLQESRAAKTPDQEKFLKHNFETLTNEFSNEKFDSTLKDLQPNAENESSFFLNPRLSISARFLSRCQKNSRMAAAFPPKVQQQCQHLPDTLCKSTQLNAEMKPFVDGHGSELGSSFNGTKHLRDEEMCQTVESEYSGSEWDIKSMSSKAEKPLSLEVKGATPNNKRHQMCKRSASVIDLVQEEQTSSDSFVAVAQSSLQNVLVNEGSKQRHSLCSKMDMLAATLSKEMSKNKLCKPRSYMHPTASFKAKMSRSASVGENLHLKTLGRSSGMSLPNSRAASTVDLTESMKGSIPSEDSPSENFKVKVPPKEILQNGTLSYGNHQARASLTLNLSKMHTDRLLMPPPIPNSIGVTKVKQKLQAGQDSTRLPTLAVPPKQPTSLAKNDQTVCENHVEKGNIPNMNSFTILKKATDNSEHCNSSQDGTDRTLEKFPSWNSILVQPQNDSISPNRDVVSCNSIPIPEGNGIPKDVPKSLRGSMGIEEKPTSEADLVVSIENCEYVVTELQNSLQKALQLYSKVISSEDAPELKSQMMAILCDAFSSAKKHMNSVECLPVSTPLVNKPLFASESLENGKATALLEHYSELLIKMMAQKLQLQH